jgi:hypothetical protein
MKGPLDSYSTMHSERLHKTNAKQPAKRTNFRDAVSFTKQLVRFVEDRDILFDIYGPLSPNPVTTSVALPSTQQPLFSLTSYYKDKKFHHIDYIEQQQNLPGLHTHVRLYLHSLTTKSTRRISLANCKQLDTPNVTAYGQLSIAETNDDLSKCKTWIRAGFFFNNYYNDFIRAVDVTKQKLSSGFQEFYGKVVLFVEVLYDGKKYRLCIGQLFKETNVAHPTGYKTLLLMSNPRPELFVCCVEHILEKVYIVPDFGDANDDTFLLNHDVSQYAWANAAPVPYELDSDSYIGWKSDDEADDQDNDDDIGSDGSDDDNNSIESEDDDLVEFSQF